MMKNSKQSYHKPKVISDYIKVSALGHSYTPNKKMLIYWDGCGIFCVGNKSIRRYVIKDHNKWAYKPDITPRILCKI